MATKRSKKRVLFLALSLLIIAGGAFGFGLIEPLVPSWEYINGVLSTRNPISMGKPVYSLTEDTVLTEAQCRGAIINNQGDAGEQDLTMYASTQGHMVMFVQEEAQVMEVGPETDGYIILDGTALDQNDCVDSDGATIGSYMMCIRGKNASGTAVWNCVSDGNWSDTGASD